jgi:peroxiredoxin
MRLRTPFALGSCVTGVLLFAWSLYSQKQIAAIDFGMPDLGKLSDSERALAVSQLALKIRTFSGCAEKAVLASELANSADSVPDNVLREVATTYAEALEGCPGNQWENAYLELATMIRDTQMNARSGDPRLAAALGKVDAEYREIETADFSLTDMHGKPWTLKQLRGKVVLLNFWGTGCPPCVQEIPALDAMYDRFRAKGLVTLAITGFDDTTAVRSFLKAHRVSYPILPDSGHEVTDRFHVVAIPRSLVLDRSGKLTASAIGSRTQDQFVEMLGEAGLR